VWGIPFADLRYRYRQFLIAVIGAGQVLAMALLMPGLVGGFSAEINRTVGGIGAERWVLAEPAVTGGQRRSGSVALPASTFATLPASTFATLPASAFATLPAIALAVRLVASFAAMRRATGADSAAACAG
jgi:hypothetical protein